MPSINSTLVRPLVRKLHAYVPGEQPKIPGLIKLNTNENPFPPSPKVLAAVKAAVDGRLRLYPNPAAQLLREKLAKLHCCRPENIITGNGRRRVTERGQNGRTFSGHTLLSENDYDLSMRDISPNVGSYALLLMAFGNGDIYDKTADISATRVRCFY